MSYILPVILVIEIGTFFLVDYLFQRKESASALSDMRISQRKLRVIYSLQLLFIMVGGMYLADISWTIITLNQQKEQVDTSSVEGQIRRAGLSIDVVKAQRDWYISVMAVVVNILLYFYILLQRQLNKRQDNVLLRRRSKEVFESKFLYRGKTY